VYTVCGEISKRPDIAQTSSSTCVLLATKTVECKGQQSSYLLGNIENGGYRNEFGLVPDVEDAIRLVCGRLHCCALQNTGLAICWGNAQDGQTGSGTMSSSNPPTPVKGELRFDDIWAFADRTCAKIISLGDIYCWGSNVGRTPVKIDYTSVRNAELVSGGDEYMCFLNNGELRCMGTTNNNNILGHSSTAPEVMNTPTLVNLPTLRQVSCRSYRCAAVSTAGKLYLWGDYSSVFGIVYSTPTYLSDSYDNFISSKYLCGV